MTQWLRSLAALPEDLHSIHTLTCNSPLSVTQMCMPAKTPAYTKLKIKLLKQKPLKKDLGLGRWLSS